MEDLAQYQAIERKPIHGTYWGYDIYGMPPASSGGVTQVQILNILEEYDLSKMGHNSAHYLHILTESMRRAFRDKGPVPGRPGIQSRHAHREAHLQRICQEAATDDPTG